ncbi:GIY-YIG nuclease family protein [Shewanella sp. SM101]|uniref:GIY-YIG nuclease family protein n=1 Tax=unclassified Shewanella TaxID=196818 RepID=UPI0021D7DDEC|nr:MULTISPECIES: GIY-YIG nuclease family protein [unclassified Shewanella]MCU7999442.1 GIY-YIG nuclease family protein [Shewanella sp. SM95]MCU8003991.1 GIY-YIG nuclease family protein [Shewanella sp. SM96]MCU8107400.1 GIY-YIG nuclease family protein [Shewanella sp. SM101]
MSTEVQSLSPLANKIVDKAIDNVTRKLVVGVRNRKNSRPDANSVDFKSELTDILSASNTSSAIDIAGRTSDWKEVITKSFSHGVSSLSTIKFDSEFTVSGGVARGLDSAYDGPGVYVVYDKHGSPVYVGDAEKVKKRWSAGHLNENKQKAKNGEQYKLAAQFEEGCTVKVLHTDTKETAAAIEANLIANHKDELINSKEELKNNQGTRSNIEAKKMKEGLNSDGELVAGAAKEVSEQAVASAIEGLIASAIKHLKVELVDLFKGGKTKAIDRMKRFLQAVFNDIKNLKTNLEQMLKGIFEAIIGLVSQTIAQVYNLARNIFDLAANAYNVYKGKDSMSTEEMLNKIIETIVISSSLVLWDALDVVIEGLIFPYTGIFTGVIAGIISAIGFGITSHILSQFVPGLVQFILGFGLSHQLALEERRASYLLLVESYNLNEELYESSGALLQSELRVMDQMKVMTAKFEEPVKEVNKIEKRNFLSQLKELGNE